MKHVFLFILIVSISYSSLWAFDAGDAVNNLEVDFLYIGEGFDSLIFGSSLGYEYIDPAGFGIKGSFFMNWMPITPLFLDLAISIVLNRLDEYRNYSALIDYDPGYFYDVYTYEYGTTMTANIHFIELGVRPFLLSYEEESYSEPTTRTSFGDIQIYGGWRYSSIYSEIAISIDPFEFYAHGILGFANARENVVSSTSTNGAIIPGFEIGLRWSTLAAKLLYYDNLWIYYLTIGIKFSW